MGNEMADKKGKHASILGHESEGVVTPAGLRAWARREKWPARMVQKGLVRIHSVPDEQRTTEQVAVQNREGGVRQVQVCGGNDGDTRRGRLSRTRPMETAQSGVKGVERSPRGAGGKQERGGGRFTWSFHLSHL